MQSIFIPIRINYYHVKSGTKTVSTKAFHSLEECQKFFDNNHHCSDRLCDYCRAKWKENKKSYDNDGAFIECICHEVKIKNFK